MCCVYICRLLHVPHVDTEARRNIESPTLSSASLTPLRKGSLLNLELGR